MTFFAAISGWIGRLMILFAAVGQAGATLFVAIFPLMGLVSAICILPEVYGYDSD